MDFASFGPARRSREVGTRREIDVEVLLATHDADGVTALDVQLASFMDAAAAGR